MKDKDTQLIWEQAQTVSEMWEASPKQKKRAYDVGYKTGEAGGEKGEVSDNWGPAGDAYVQGYRDGQAASNKELGVHARPDAGQSLAEYGFKIVRDTDHELDEPRERYGPDQYEVRASTPETMKKYGDGILSRLHVSEAGDMSEEELEQMVIRSLNDHGKPLFFRPYSK